MRPAPVRSFGRPEEPEPEMEAPVVFPPIQLPVQFIADPQSLRVLGAQIAAVVGQALHDAIASAIDPDGDEIPVDSGPAPDLSVVEPGAGQLADLR